MEGELKPAKGHRSAERAELRESSKGEGEFVKAKKEVVAKPKAVSGVEYEASPLTGAAGSLGTTPTPKTEKTAPKKRVRVKKEEVLTDQPDFDPPESDGMETC